MKRSGGSSPPLPDFILPRRTAALVIILILSLAATAQIELEPQVFKVAEKLRCPVCVSESVAQSASPTSVQMRQLISEKLAAGESEEEILAYFQARYGNWILLEPPKRGLYLVVWVLPILVGLGILGALVHYLSRWTRRGREIPEADPHYLDTVRASQHQALGGDGHP